MFLSCMTSCSGGDSSNYTVIARKIMRQFVKDMHNKNGYTCTSSGGAFMHNISKIQLGFETLGPKSQNELRIELVEMVEDFLNRINSNVEIREYLVNYPFRAENLDFGLYLVDENGKPIKNKGSGRERLYGIVIGNGKICYVFENEEQFPLQYTFEESYEEALANVKGKNS